RKPFTVVLVLAAWPTLELSAQTYGWTLASSPAAPSAREGHAMAYDSSQQRVVLVGGNVGNGSPRADTWAWDGRRWSLVLALNLPARFGHAMAYDAARQRL